jgi:phenylacetate-coenzyme A ligase PaaK-like adenylate-forming protein
MSLKTFLKSSSIGDIVIRRTPLLYGHYRSLLARSRDAAADERRARRTALTARTQRLASETAYARAKGLSGPYEDWPLLEKGALRDFGETMTRKVILPAGQAETGGSTGIPVALTRSWQSVVFEQAALDDLVAQHGGIEWRRVRIAVLRGDNIKDPSDTSPPFWKLQRNGRTLAMSAVHLNAKTVSAYLDALSEYKPNILWVYPTALESLCGLMNGQAQKIPDLKLILSSSEVLTNEAYQLARNAFGVPVLDYYGQAERVSLSYSIDGLNHYFHPIYGRVELTYFYSEDDHDLYDIVGTSYWNDAQPLVRFCTGDHARLPKGLTKQDIDDVALGLRPFLGIAGRAEEYLLSPDGVRILGINHIPRGIPDVVQMQLHQRRPDSVEIWVVPKPGYSEDTANLVLAKARQKIPASVSIEIVQVSGLYRTSRGKAPMMVRHS